jgi:UPF0755 protein
MKIFKKKNIRDLFSSRWLINKDFSKLSPKDIKRLTTWAGLFLLVIFLVFFFEVYIPINPNSHETITYTVSKGWGDEEIAEDLESLGIIRSSAFLKLYTILSLRHSMLQAGKYNISPKMSAYQIVKKMALGDVIKNKLRILEGWGIQDIAKYLEEKEICEQDHFIFLTEKDYSESFDFLKDKPKNVSLEGYLFPDTYEIDESESCEKVLTMMLSNFGKKLTSELREEIANQNKTIFDIITMAGMLEKEVRTIEDKKIVSGILWKRLSIGMPLQIDATVNYVTGKSDSAVLIKDTKVDSPYNTYKYKGLPRGPISNPGIESILAAINPTESKYWFYLTNGKTIFSETFEQHNRAKSIMKSQS